MIRTSANTTSLSTAIRPTGFQVYPLVDVQELSVHSNPVLTPKKYGKAIKPEHLPDRTSAQTLLSIHTTHSWTGT
ncbi:hypothetical protein BKA82DRAFT_4215484, partial [Pisolithus tinctorius]